MHPRGLVAACPNHPTVPKADCLKKRVRTGLLERECEGGGPLRFSRMVRDGPTCGRHEEREKGQGCATHEQLRVDGPPKLRFPPWRAHTAFV